MVSSGFTCVVDVLMSFKPCSVVAGWRVLAALAICFPAFGQNTHKISIVAPGTVTPGQEFVVEVIFDIEAPWYIYAPTGAAAAMGMVETRLTVTPPVSIQAGKLQLPPHREKAAFDVYEGAGITLAQTFRVRPRATPGEYRIDGAVRYQVCNPELCLPPARREFRIRLSVELEQTTMWTPVPRAGNSQASS